MPNFIKGLGYSRVTGLASPALSSAWYIHSEMIVKISAVEQNCPNPYCFSERRYGGGLMVQRFNKEGEETDRTIIESLFTRILAAQRQFSNY